MPGERTRLHLALAKALDAEPGLAADPAGNPAAELAFHWRACHRLEDALATSVAAGLQAEKSYAWAEANQHFENVLELWERVEDAERRAGMDHAAALLRAARDASWSGQLRRAVTLARSAVAEIDADPVRESLARERFAEFLWLSGDSPAALEVLRGAVNLLASPSQERGRLLSAEGRLLMLHGRPEESRSRCEEAIAIARRIGDRAEEGRALNTLGCDDMFIGDRRTAEERLRKAMRIASDFAPHDLWRAYGNLAEALDQDGRVEEGVQLGIEGAEVARGLGQRAWTTFLLGTVAERLVRLGRFEEAEGCARTGLEAFHEGIDVATLFCVLAEVALHRGEVEQAQAKLERALEAAGRTADLLTGGMITHAMTRLAMARGENDQAAQLVEEAMEGLGDVEYVFYNGSGYALAMRAHAERAERARSLGDTSAAAEAEESGAAVMERFKRLLEPDKWVDSPPPESLARFALAGAELGRLKGNPSPRAWSEVAGQWQKLGFPVERAYARWRQAEAVLAAGGARVEAADALREAARLAADCEASLLGAEIEALARRARIQLGDGAEAASVEAASPDANRFGLTDRELEVLALVVEGRTNREIGETLFISAKTASAHVSHILTKLDVRTRVEAATAAHKLELLSQDQTDQSETPIS
jgi:DNA-binding CsgD family transcriptional regulator